MKARPVKVLIVDDQALVRRGLAKLLEIEDAVEVVGEAADGVDALRLLPPGPTWRWWTPACLAWTGSSSSGASPRSTRVWPPSY